MPPAALPLGVAVRAALSDDAPAIADAHLVSWQAAYRGLLSDADLGPTGGLPARPIGPR